MTQLSVKTLRHYHEVGLVEPDFIDPFTGYRYYAPGQGATAQVVRRLRELSMPIADVRAVLASAPGAVRARRRPGGTVPRAARRTRRRPAPRPARRRRPGLPRSASTRWRMKSAWTSRYASATSNSPGTQRIPRNGWRIYAGRCFVRTA